MSMQAPQTYDTADVSAFRHTIISLGRRPFKLTGTDEPCWLSFMPSERKDCIAACAVFDDLWAFLLGDAQSAETVISGLKLEDAVVERTSSSYSVIDHVAARPGHEEYLLEKLPEDIQAKWHRLSLTEQSEHLDHIWEAYWVPLFDIEQELFDFVIKPAMTAS